MMGEEQRTVEITEINTDRYIVEPWSEPVRSQWRPLGQSRSLKKKKRGEKRKTDGVKEDEPFLYGPYKYIHSRS